MYRAKEKLRLQNARIEIPSEKQMEASLDEVLLTIYLLFNEGYYSVNRENAIDKDICFEAMRLCTMLTESPLTNKPAVNALLGLMYFHASRLEARTDEKGAHILYDEQDTALWDKYLISRGAMYLHRSSNGNNLSKYHIEAMIAWWRTQKLDNKEKWEAVLALYEKLLLITYSPVAALNRVFAIANVLGKECALAEVEKVEAHKDQFYFMLMGYLCTGIEVRRAIFYYGEAFKLAKTEADKALINKKINALNTQY